MREGMSRGACAWGYAGRPSGGPGRAEAGRRGERAPAWPPAGGGLSTAFLWLDGVRQLRRQGFGLIQSFSQQARPSANMSNSRPTCLVYWPVAAFGFDMLGPVRARHVHRRCCSGRSLSRRQQHQQAPGKRRRENGESRSTRQSWPAAQWSEHRLADRRVPGLIRGQGHFTSAPEGVRVGGNQINVSLSLSPLTPPFSPLPLCLESNGKHILG